MKRIFTMLLFMFSIYIFIQLTFNFFNTGYEMTYIVGVNDKLSAKVKEKNIKRIKNETNNYIFDIDIDGTKFVIETFNNYGFSKELIRSIDYYNGKYKCIYPHFRDNEQVTDVLCDDNGITKNYRMLSGYDENLDSFVKSLKGYDENKFTDNQKDDYNFKNITVYKSNLARNHYLAINDYNGIYILSRKVISKVNHMKLFSNDEYTKKLTTIVSKYYVSADYDSKYDFNRFAVVDIEKNKLDYINMTTRISFNSYIQGVVGDSLYIYDKSNKTQYQLDIKHKRLITLGKSDAKIISYNNGKWEDINAYEAASDEVKFKYYEESSDDTYQRIIKNGNKLSGFYYYVKRNGNLYDVYRAPIGYKDKLTYIFKTDDPNSLKFVGEYVYYNYNNAVRYYSDITGNKTVYENTEYQFNKTLTYYIHES